MFSYSASVRVVHLRSCFSSTLTPDTLIRPQIYCSLLGCPSSSKFFALLSSPEDDEFQRNFRAEWQLDDPTLQTRMERCALEVPCPALIAHAFHAASILHLLHAQGFNPIVLIELPPLLHGFITSFPAHTTSLQELFEIVLTVLCRWGRMWWDDDRDGTGIKEIHKLVRRCLKDCRILELLDREEGRFEVCFVARSRGSPVEEALTCSICYSDV